MSTKNTGAERWAREASLKNGKNAHLRPVTPDDAAQLNEFVKRMSPESRYFRFMHAIKELSPSMAEQLTNLDFDREMAFVALDDNQEIIGVSRYFLLEDNITAEFAAAVADDWQSVGLASALMHLLIEHATDKNISQLQGDVLTTNASMQNLMKSLGFVATRNPDELDIAVFKYSIDSNADQT